METKTIAKINNIEIAVSNDKPQLVPIKPICEAMGIDFPSQFQKIKDDEDLNSVIGLVTTTGRDGKQYNNESLGRLCKTQYQNENIRRQISRVFQ